MRLDSLVTKSVINLLSSWI